MSNQTTVYLNSYTRNGIGDRLLDILGMYVISKISNGVVVPIIKMAENHAVFMFGVTGYDFRLFNFNQTHDDAKIVVYDETHTCEYFDANNSSLAIPCCSTSLSPLPIYRYIKNNQAFHNIIDTNRSNYIKNMSFEDFAKIYRECAKEFVRPSEIIEKSIPTDILSRTIGVHLRRSDKRVNHGGGNFACSESEYDRIILVLLDDIAKRIQQSKDQRLSFFFCSEDIGWKNEFINTLKNKLLNEYGITDENPFDIVELDYSNGGEYINYNAVLDFFALSRCNEIYQCVKYTTFSTLASLMGSGLLHNYMRFSDFPEIGLFRLYDIVFSPELKDGCYRPLDEEFIDNNVLPIVSKFFINGGILATN